MKELTLVFLGKRKNIKEDHNIEIIFSNGLSLNKIIEKANGKYIAFIKEEDNLSKNYLKKVLEKTKTEFDCCFINYDILFDYKNKVKISTHEKELANIKPYFGEYIWAFIFNKEKLSKLLEIRLTTDFNKFVNEEFTNCTAIGDLIYFHNPKGSRYLKSVQLVDTKRNEYYKNVIYVGDGCRGLFNGYVSWVKNIGRCFSNKYEIVVLYDKIHPKILKVFSEYFKCVRRATNINYVCESLSMTYSTYYYPKNIFTTKQNYLFIHGNMSDYKSVRIYHHDIFSHYVAVSKTTAKKAVGYFPTNNIEYIVNPIKIDKKNIKPHLKLTSAFRYCDVKKPERVEKMAKILDELEIPYTWNLFTDKKVNTNAGGLIYRQSVEDVIPYIKDSDYFVLLSDSEAMPYCILEALSVNTKVVVTPLESYNELGLVNKKNATIIPFEYFEEENENKLTEIIKKMYEKKEKKVNYKIDESLWDGYNDIFIK